MVRRLDTQDGGLVLELRPAERRDLEFAWQLYRESMRILTEELMPWDDNRQRQGIIEAVTSGATQIIIVDGEEAGWLVASPSFST